MFLLLYKGRVSATVVGTVYSGPTTADPLAVYWNPGATTLLTGTSALIYSGATLIALDYQRTTPNNLDGGPFEKADMFAAKPDIAFGFVTDIGLEDLRLGVSLATPVLDGGRWHIDYGGQPSSTRYYVIEGHQAHILIRPAVAYRLHPTLSVGAGLDIVGIWIHGDSLSDLGARFNQLACQANPASCAINAPFPREDPTLAARVRGDALGWDVGLAAGALWTPLSWLRLGVGFASGAGDMTIPVDIRVDLPPTAVEFVQQTMPGVRLPDLNASADIRTHSPMMVTAGLMVLPADRLELTADLHWIRKSRMSVTMIDIRKAASDLVPDQVMVKVVKDAWTVGLRGSYRLLPQLSVALRGELTTNTMPERFTTPVSLDFDKIMLQAGLAWQVTPWLGVVVEYGHAFLFPRIIDESAFAPNADPRTAVEEGLDKPSPLGKYTGYSVKLNGAVQVTF
jgi:long-subunit fatty acid transport protein